MVGRGNPQVANVLRSGMEQLTNWVRNPIQPGGVSSVRAVVVLAFGDARHCANDALAWITANQFVGTPAGSLQASTEVWAQGPVAQALPKHHIITSLSSVPFTANEDLRRAVPKVRRTGPPAPVLTRQHAILDVVGSAFIVCAADFMYHPPEPLKSC